MNLYTGLYRHGVDANRRVQLPAQWRGRNATVFHLLPWPPQSAECILALAPERFRSIQEQVRSRGSRDPETIRALERHFASQPRCVNIDAAGRLQITEDSANLAGIAREVVLVGRFDRFEIWDPQCFDGKCAETPDHGGVPFNDILP